MCSPPPVGFGGASPPRAFFVLNGMTLEGQLRKLGNEFCIKLVKEEENPQRGEVKYFCTPPENLRLRPCPSLLVSTTKT